MTEPTTSTTTTTNAIASTPEGSTPPGASVTEPRSLRVRIISSLGFAAIAIVGVLIVLYAWQLPPFSSAVETTENALVRGQVTIIGPQLSGYVFEVPVQDFQHVKAGDLLVRLDDRIYKQRLDQFDFDMILMTLNQTLSPGLEQWQYFHSSQAGVKGSKNYAGIQNPVVDHLLEQLLAAQTRDEQLAAGRALDRVLLWQRYSIPNWYLNFHRLAYRNRFAFVTTPPYSLGLSAWWLKASEKAQ